VELKRLAEFNVNNHLPAVIISKPNDSRIGGILNARGIDPELPEIPALRREEGYLVDQFKYKGKPLVLVLSEGAAGRYYGVQTFLQTLRRKGTSIPAEYDVPEVTICDWPRILIRANHISHPSVYYDEVNIDVNEYDMSLLMPRDDNEGQKGLYVLARFLSRLKINTFFIESPVFYCLEEDSAYSGLKNHQIMDPFFDYCRDYYIEPVPLMQCFGHGKKVLQFVPEGAETCWVGGAGKKGPGDPPIAVPLPQYYEEFTGGYDTRYVIKGQWVIDTANRPISLFKEVQGGILVPLTRDVDYEVFRNEIKYDMIKGYSTTMIEGGNHERQNAGIHIINQSIPQGTKFYLKYNFINDNHPLYSETGHGCCPKESTMQNFLEDRVAEVVNRLNPRYIHFGHDEPNQMHTCSLCNPVTTEPPLTANGELFGNHVNGLRGYFIDALGGGYDPEYHRIMIYADHVSDNHEARKDYPMGMYGGRYGGLGGKVSTCKTVI
jgi:hypothetical protein